MDDKKESISKSLTTIDASGTKTENLIRNEATSALVSVDGQYLTVAGAPFYENNFRLVLKSKANTPVEAVRGIDYDFALNFSIGERIVGKRIWFAIKILKADTYTVNGTISGFVSYQSVGDIPFNNNETDSERMLSTFSYNNGNFDDLHTSGLSLRKKYLRNLVNSGKQSIDQLDPNAYENPLWWRELPVVPASYWMSIAALLKPANVVSIKKPILISPANNAVNISLTPTLVGNPFELRVITPPNGNPADYVHDTIALAEFQIWDELPDTGQIVHAKNVTTFPVSIMDEVAAATLQNSRVYYARVRYTGHVYPVSEWSDFVKFTTAAAAIVDRIATPTIVFADAVAPDTGKGGNFKGSRFAMLSGADSIVSSDWEFYASTEDSTLLLSAYNQKNTDLAFSIAGISMNPDQTDMFVKQSVSVHLDLSAVYSGNLRDSAHSLLVKMDQLGNIVWEIATDIGVNVFAQVKHDNDGNVITHGFVSRFLYPAIRTGEVMDVVVSKFSPTGVLPWAKVIKSDDVGTSHDITPSVVAVDTDNNIIIVGSDKTAIGTEAAYYYTQKLSSAGVLLWSKARKVVSPNNEFTTPSLLVRPDNSIIVAATATPIGSFDTGEIHCWKFDTDGVLKWNNKFVPEFGMPLAGITTVSNADSVIGSDICLITKVKTSPNANSVRAVIIVVTRDGEFVNAKSVVEQGSILAYIPLEGTNVLLAGSDRNNDFYLAKVNRANNTVLWGKTSQNGRSISYYDKTPCSILITDTKVIAGFSNVGIYEKKVLETSVAELVYDNNIFGTILSILDFDMTFGTNVSFTKTAASETLSSPASTVSTIDLDFSATATTVGDYDISGFVSTLAEFPGLRVRTGGVLSNDNAAVRVRYNTAKASHSEWSDKYAFMIKKARPYLEVETPVIDINSPGQVNVDAADITKSFKATAFKMTVGTANPHHSIWEIFTTVGNDPFDTVVINDPITMNVLPFSLFKPMVAGVGYQVRVMYVTDKLAGSRWSVPLSLTTLLVVPPSPTIAKPVVTIADASSVASGSGALFRSSPFAMLNGNDQIATADWELYADGAGTVSYLTKYNSINVKHHFTAQGYVPSMKVDHPSYNTLFNNYNMSIDSTGKAIYTTYNSSENASMVSKLGQYKDIEWQLTTDLHPQMHVKSLAIPNGNGADDVITYGVVNKYDNPNSEVPELISMVYLSKINAAGVKLWSTGLQYKSGIHSSPFIVNRGGCDIKADINGNIYVSGVDGIITYVHKLNSDGMLLWTKQFANSNPYLQYNRGTIVILPKDDGTLTIAISYETEQSGPPAEP